MKVLITSGGTTEPIDDVRGISNFATGALGKLTAEYFLRAGHEVILLSGDKALRPEPQERLTLVPIMGTQSLYEAMQDVVPQVDVVVHSMAVSDYRPVYMTDFEHLPDELTEASLTTFRPKREKKISSKADFQIMLLEKTPKIINAVKQWNPDVLLFGFKLLSGVTPERLLKIAHEKLSQTKADFIIANDLENIQGQAHQAYLVSEKDADRVISMKNKSQIAATILKKSEELRHD